MNNILVSGRKTEGFWGWFKGMLRPLRNCINNLLDRCLWAIWRDSDSNLVIGDENIFSEGSNKNGFLKRVLFLKIEAFS